MTPKIRTLIRRRTQLARPTASARLRTLSAVVAAAALVAVSMTVVVSPAAAANRAADVRPATEACVGAALEPFGFVDIANLSSDRQQAINCLAYYGVTAGRTLDPATFDPHSNVTRSQMALFLHRTAIIAGIDLEPTADDPIASFSDVADLGEERQSAISALYAKGIMMGRSTVAGAAVGASSSETFVPHAAISRAEMAQYLWGFVRAANPDLADDDGNIAGVDSPDYFADVRDSATSATNTAVSAIFELGITAGQTPDTYAPAGSVPRGNMALFITRALAHTTARPAGLSAQSAGATVVVSQRDRNFQPVEDLDDSYVDVFASSIDEVEDAFTADGSCDEDVVSEIPRYYHEPCVIDVGDARPEDGDVTVDLSDELTSEGLVVWVWTGSLRDEAEEDETLSVRFDPGDLPPPSAAQLTVTFSGLRSQPDGSPVMTARKGTLVRVHLQLQGRYAGSENFVDVPASTEIEKYALVLETTVPDGSDADSDRDVYERVQVDDVGLDADGSGSFRLPVRSMDDYQVTFTLTPIGDAPSPEPGTGTVSFVNVESEPTTVVVDPVNDWLPVGAADRSTGNNVRVLVNDQYGRPISGVDVLLKSSESGFRLATRGSGYTTRNNGVLIGYSYTGGAAIETLTAGVDGNDDDMLDNCDADPVVDVCATARVYWAEEAADTSSTTTYVVEHADTNGDKIVVSANSGATVVVVDYGAAATGDVFNVGGMPGGATYAEDLAAFEAALQDAADSPGTYELTWDQTTARRWMFNLLPPA